LTDRISVELDAHVLLIGLNRAEKRNAFDLAMIETVGLAAWDNSAHGAQCLDQSCNVLTAYALNFGGLPRTNRP